MQFIDGETVDDAATREAVCHQHQPVIIGVDVARYGDDQQVIACRRGLDARSIALQKFRGLDLVTLAGKVAETAMLHGARAVFIDEGGMGAGVVDMTRQMLPGLLVVGVNFGGKADRYTLGQDFPLTADKAAEMWASLRFWLKTGAIPADAELKAELTGRQYGYDTHNAIRLERKDDMKKRGLASPDVADALALTFAYPVADMALGENAAAHGALYGDAARTARDEYDPHADA
jgi:hypothetical protein